MKIKICIIIVLLSTQVFPQNYSLNFINALGNKKTASWEDATTFYVLITGRVSRGFNADVKILKAMGIVKRNKYKKDEPLRKRMLAEMIARHLKLKDSLFYLIFKNEGWAYRACVAANVKGYPCISFEPRYAYRVCVADGLFDIDGSEWDKMSGEELIEVMRLVSERME